MTRPSLLRTLACVAMSVLGGCAYTAPRTAHTSSGTSGGALGNTAGGVSASAAAANGSSGSGSGTTSTSATSRSSSATQSTASAAASTAVASSTAGTTSSTGSTGSSASSSAASSSGTSGSSGSILLPDGGTCPTGPVLACASAPMGCECSDGTSTYAGCGFLATCQASCCAHGGVCAGPYAIGPCDGKTEPCPCADGSTVNAGCGGPTTCDEACCGRGGGWDGGADACNLRQSGSCPPSQTCCRLTEGIGIFYECIDSDAGCPPPCGFGPDAGVCDGVAP